MVHPPSALPPPDPAAADHSARLQRAIVEAIRATDGWIRFDRYMELALYTPGLGYYAAGARKFGDWAAGGDFVTAPEISPLFASALATQVAQVFAHTPAHIVEFGAGSGVLARDLLDALAARGIAVARYAIVELSPDLAARQRVLLEGRGVEWLTAPPRRFEGVMLANEVLDVMPVRLFVMRGRLPRERGVGLQGDALTWVDRDADAELRDAVSAIEREVGELPDGYGSEINFAGRAWMRSVADWLARGVLFAIDYGFPRREYYHPQRLMGTLMCHYRHHAHADPLWLPGLNDITAHVDFTAMADAAHAAELAVLGYTTQAHFLMNCGLLDQLGAGHSPRRANEVQRLLSEAEMGELFKVLAVGRGVREPLVGFARGDRLARL
ncbi:MAG TPA: SAM-dependent methyltransferase [Burkholderiaceae bacterium]|nr:SAM-dependent methyltransferase [Burkholderiaceae bacterium]